MLRGGVFLEQADQVDAGEGGEDGGAGGLVVDRAGRAFEAGDGGIRVQADDQAVAHGAALFEQMGVARVQDVEAAIGEADLVAAGAPAFGGFGGGGGGDDFAQGARWRG